MTFRGFSQKHPINDYDSLPKFLFSNTKHVDTITKDTYYELAITHEGRNVRFRIRPGVVERSGGRSIIAFPGEREEMVSRVLRYMAVQKRARYASIPDKNRNDAIGLEFSLHEVQRHLIDCGHHYNLAQIDEAISILAKTEITIFYEDDKRKAFDSFRLLDRYSGQDDKMDATNRLRRVVLNDMETTKILQPDYRALNFHRLKTLKSPVARRLYEIIITQHIAANKPLDGRPEPRPYELRLSLLLKVLCIKEGKNKRSTLQRVRAAFAELKDAGVFWSKKPYVENIEYETVTKGRPAIADIVWKIFLSAEDVQDIIAANAEASAYNPKNAELLRLSLNDSQKLSMRKNAKRQLKK